jgi:hypothetical protein
MSRKAFEQCRNRNATLYIAILLNKSFSTIFLAYPQEFVNLTLLLAKQELNWSSLMSSRSDSLRDGKQNVRVWVAVILGNLG